MKKITVIAVILIIFLFAWLTWSAPFSASEPITSASEIHNVTVLPDGKVLVR
jgi:hypothetical protein